MTCPNHPPVDDERWPWPCGAELFAGEVWCSDCVKAFGPPSACCDAQVDIGGICVSCEEPAPRCGRAVEDCTEDGRGECDVCEVWRVT